MYNNCKIWMQEELLWKLFGILVFCLLWCCLCPKAQAAMISQKQEIEMGQQVAQQLENHYGLVQDDEIQDRVSRIGQKRWNTAPAPGLTYTFKVLNTPDVNALACPGGFIYVYKGLLDYMTSDDELAAVLGHEIGHIEKRHTVHQMEQQMALSLLTLLAGVASRGRSRMVPWLPSPARALMAGYSRKDEREADQEGFRLSTLAGYNPYGSYVTMAKLEDMSKDMGNPGYGLFASHPDPGLRMERALKWTEPLKIPEKVTVAGDGTACRETGLMVFPITETAGYDKPEYRHGSWRALYLAQEAGNWMNPIS